MPERKTIKKAKQDKRQGKAASTQAGEFVRDEIERIRHGEHGARSTKQAIAIGLSKARRAGVKLKAPEHGAASEEVIEHAKRDLTKGQNEPNAKPNPKRSRATVKALKREGHEAASSEALSRQAKQQARKRSPAERSKIARKAAATRLAHESPAERKRIARKAARTRKARQSK
jgi:hypothetical protein